MIQHETCIKNELSREQKWLNFHQKRCEEIKKSMDEVINQKIDIYIIALDLLKELGFDEGTNGSKYLADIIVDLYHERKLFDKTNEYFNLQSSKNNHYLFLKEYYGCGVLQILEEIDCAIKNSYLKDYNIQSIVYIITNDIIDQYDRTSEIKKYSIHR